MSKRTPHLRKFATELKGNQELQGPRQKRLHCAQENLLCAREILTGHRMNSADSHDNEKITCEHLFDAQDIDSLGRENPRQHVESVMN